MFDVHFLIFHFTYFYHSVCLAIIILFYFDALEIHM